MGLDMYLTAEHYYWRDDKRPEIPEIPTGYNLRTITVEAAYWRKANQIHNWFVKNVQDGVDNCEPYYVSMKDLVTLRELCKEVLADHSKAETLLPVQSGFFFGSSDYDDWYFMDLQDTVEQLDKVFESFPSDAWSFEYRASW